MHLYKIIIWNIVIAAAGITVFVDRKDYNRTIYISILCTAIVFVPNSDYS